MLIYLLNFGNQLIALFNLEQKITQTTQQVGQSLGQTAKNIAPQAAKTFQTAATQVGQLAAGTVSAATLGAVHPVVSGTGASTALQVSVPTVATIGASGTGGFLTSNIVGGTVAANQAGVTAVGYKGPGEAFQFDPTQFMNAVNQCKPCMQSAWGSGNNLANTAKAYMTTDVASIVETQVLKLPVPFHELMQPCLSNSGCAQLASWADQDEIDIMLLADFAAAVGRKALQLTVRYGLASEEILASSSLTEEGYQALVQAKRAQKLEAVVARAASGSEVLPVTTKVIADLPKVVTSIGSAASSKASAVGSELAGAGGLPGVVGAPVSGGTGIVAAGQASVVGEGSTAAEEEFGQAVAHAQPPRSGSITTQIEGLFADTPASTKTAVLSTDAKEVSLAEPLVTGSHAAKPVQNISEAVLSEERAAVWRQVLPRGGMKNIVPFGGIEFERAPIMSSPLFTPEEVD